MPSCSFCGRSRGEVGALVAGPTVYICGECVELAQEILAKQLGAGAGAPTAADRAAARKELEHWRKFVVVEDLAADLAARRGLPEPVRVRAEAVLDELRALFAEISRQTSTDGSPPSGPEPGGPG